MSKLRAATEHGKRRRDGKNRTTDSVGAGFVLFLDALPGGRLLLPFAFCYKYIVRNLGADDRSHDVDGLSLS
jgi:hypothetical protein